MKATRFVRAIAVTAVGALAIAGVSAVAAPAGAATRSTVVIVESNALTSLNPAMPDTNLTINNDVAYLTGSSFNYYDDKKNLVKNTVLGSYKIIKNAPKDFRVEYKINKGKVWSDGTPIDGVDLLLSHVLNSGAYSVKAGLGDPKNTEKTPAFNSINYGGVYDNHVVGLPTLSADKMSVVIRYDAFQPDWEILGPGVNPVHALVQLANGKTKLGSAAENAAAKASFLSAFKSYNTAQLTKMAKVWSESYNIKTVTSSTNPLLLVGNGAYKITGAVADQSVTLALNPKYNSGKKTSGIKTIILKMIADGTAAAQALANKEIDIYQGQPTADAVAQLKAITGVTVIGGTNSCFEHVDVRQGSINDTDYNGPFAASNNAAKNAKAKDLRTAFLLAFPRAEIVDKLVKPINSKAVVVNSSFTLPGQTGYNEIVKSSGVSKFTAGTQATRTAAALALVKKYYPTAADGSKSVAVKILWGQPSNSRRAAEAALIKAELSKAGFDVDNAGTSGWGGFLDDNKYDAAFFAWCPTNTSQTGTNANFLSDGGNNFVGYNSA
ncbi:MAG: ABC transporter substrate-binding protein, partial [Rhodoluna sp.]